MVSVRWFGSARTHSCHGFFVPTEFRRPLFDGDGEVLGGCVVLPFLNGLFWV